MAYINPEIFSNEIVLMFNRRLQDLYQTLHHHPSQESTRLTLECLEEMQVMLEELNVAEAQLRQQNDSLDLAQNLVDLERERYQELFEFAPDGYFVTDLLGHIQEANRAAAQLLNIAPQFLVGKPLVNFVPIELRRNFRSMLNHLPTLQRVQEWELKLAPAMEKLFKPP